jgi:hypothetical protein
MQFNKTQHWFNKHLLLTIYKVISGFFLSSVLTLHPYRLCFVVPLNKSHDSLTD